MSQLKQIKDSIENKTNEFYNKLSIEERQEVYELFFNQDTAEEIKQKLEKIIFYKKPPTVDEFLDPENKWLPYNVVQSIFPHVISELKEILNPDKTITKVVEYGATRLGKCEAKDTPILMYDLSVKKIQDIVIGDQLMGDDSTPRTVMHLYNGYGKLYKIKQNKADDYIVNENHILTLQYTNKNNKWNHANTGKTIDINIQEYLKLSKFKKHLLKGIKAKLEFPYQDIKIDPYFLGLWLGDGCEYHTGITTMNDEIKDFIYDYAKSLNLNVTMINENNQSNSYKIVGTTAGNQFIKSDNTLFNHLKYTYNLIHNKHIPIEYLRNSEKIRLQVLAGLLDSDGYLNKEGNCFEINQSRKNLADNVCFLSRSLGFRATIRSMKTNIGTTTYRILICGDLYKIPTKLKRKQSSLHSKVNPLRTGIQVEEYGEGEFYGFELDGNGRYLHSDLTITHNTFMARLMILYTIIYIHHLREPAMYYGLSPLTRLCIYFISFKFDKTRQLYLEPMYEIMRQSERFHQVKFQDKVRDLQNKIGRDTIVWSKAATTGEMTLASGLQLQMGNSDAISAIGSDPLQCYISEIGYFIEQEGTTEEKIFELYTNISTRIYSTVKENFLAFVYLDTSANNADSMIEKHIINELQFRPKVHFKWQSQWDARPDLFPIWQKTGETFTVVVGNGNINPCIVEDEKQLEGVPKDLILEVPIDALQFFKDNLIKEIKDIAGRPTQSENKFIQDIRLIDRIFDNPLLKNIEGHLIADSASMPEQLLWNQIKNKFFYINPQNQYKIVRAPNEWRYVSWDNAYSLKGDVMGINIKHKEWSRELNQVIYVNDLSCIVKGTDRGINLDAPKYLVIDLLQQAGLPIYAIYSDTFESEAQKQFLERHHVKFIKQSVDRTLSPYQFYSTCLMNGVLKSGRNIFLKNNLNCLMLTRNENGHEKVDHPLGQRNHIYNGDWEKSTAGCFAKDASDADCQTLWGAFQHNYIPSTCYEDENKRLSNNKEDTLDFAKIAIQNLVKSKMHY